MTDNEIIKFMQCVMGNDVNCSECAYQKTLPFPSCRRTCAKDALDLINRQKAEIERLEKELMKCKLEKEMMYQVADEIKSVAIKDFAERLKENLTGIGRSTTYGNFEYGTVKSYEIDNLVKEMTEENENDRT